MPARRGCVARTIEPLDAIIAGSSRWQIAAVITFAKSSWNRLITDSCDHMQGCSVQLELKTIRTLSLRSSTPDFQSFLVLF